MEKFRFSLDGDSLMDDSRGESELYRLREEVKRKNATIDEKGKIITSLRQQLEDLQHDSEELENSEQLMRQKLDRIQKEVGEKDETIEAISHALKEIETANENLTKRYDARVSQITKLHDELVKTKRELEESKTMEEEYHNQNELLRVELEAAKRQPRRERGTNEQDLQDLRARTERYIRENQELKSFIAELQQKNDNLAAEIKNSQTRNDQLFTEIKNSQSKNDQLLAEIRKSESKDRRDQSHEELMIELYDLRAQVKSLNHRQSRRSIDEEIQKLKQELEVTETSWRLERQHKERYARENLQLDRKVNEMTKEMNILRQKIESMSSQLSQHREQQENKLELVPAIQFPMADEIGEIMDQSSSLATKHYCQNHRIQKSQFLPTSDPLAEQKMRLERANELARRNMQTKPLHQTSYPLEYDTFGATELTETDIKRGLVPLPSLNNTKKTALNDASNQRRQVRKAEAFIV